MFIIQNTRSIVNYESEHSVFHSAFVQIADIGILQYSNIIQSVREYSPSG